MELPMPIAKPALEARLGKFVDAETVKARAAQRAYRKKPRVNTEELWREYTAERAARRARQRLCEGICVVLCAAAASGEGKRGGNVRHRVCREHVLQTELVERPAAGPSRRRCSERFYDERPARVSAGTRWACLDGKIFVTASVSREVP
jgi:hypothetical protein